MWATLSDQQQACFFYVHQPTDRIAHTIAFLTPVMEHWVEWEIAQWVHYEGLIWHPITSWVNASHIKLYLTNISWIYIESLMSCHLLQNVLHELAEASHNIIFANECNLFSNKWRQIWDFIYYITVKTIGISIFQL